MFCLWCFDFLERGGRNVIHARLFFRLTESHETYVAIDNFLSTLVVINRKHKRFANEIVYLIHYNLRTNYHDTLYFSQIT